MFTCSTSAPHFGPSALQPMSLDLQKHKNNTFLTEIVYREDCLSGSEVVANYWQMDKQTDSESEVDDSWIQLMQGSSPGIAQGVTQKIGAPETKDMAETNDGREPFNKPVVPAGEEKNRRKTSYGTKDDLPRKQEPPPKWWTPNQRPFAEPPIFDYEKFEDEQVPSVKKMKKILRDGPESIETRTMHRDLETEVGFLEAYYEE